MTEMKKITGRSLEAKSLDITNQNIEHLKQLFPDVFSEGKIDFEALKAVLGEEVDVSEERYNFTWNGKTKARQIAQTPSIGTLRPCKEESVNWDTTENLFIEGDNLEVLKLLQKSYHKKVKMIYIDPPYNTGKDFVYKDNFYNNIQNYLEQSGQVDSEGNKLSTNSDSSGRYHSDWLNMIYPRIKLARNLLCDDGVIAISINEHEVVNLRKVCDEIFGEDNFLVDLIRKTKSMNNHDKNGLNIQNENTLIYAKNKNRIVLKGDMKDFSKYKNGDNDPNGLWMSDNPTANLDGRKTKNDYEIVNPYTGTIDIPPKGRHWAFSKNSLPNLIEKGKVKFRKTVKENERGFIYKRYLNELSEKNSKVDSLYFVDNKYMNQVATKEINALFGFSAFDYTKPVSFLKKLLSFIVDDGDLVLDFFAGSASTADAVIKHSVDNSINIKFIMVQLPEIIDRQDLRELGFNTVSSISKERIRKSLNSENTSCFGMKVFKLSETNIRPWDADFDNLELVLQQAEKSIKADRSSEDVLYEIFLKYGYDLTTPVETEVVNGKTVFVVGAGALFVCLDDEITTDTVEGIAKLKEEYDPETTQVVFKDEGFADDRVKTNAIQILKQAAIDDVKSI
ncbi:site-specific DNA-methyltransferase [Vibrio rarus]|uniref:site-specific DNA-methyltransferase n=1 Tax=Vibrio rarus TaxID=413403 RepID=UPI0021C25C9F|nr:site-specific DNA-methyltransferase [Vibrio rarus]